MPEHVVSISKVKERLSNQQNSDDIVRAVDELLQSSWSQNINASVNIIKHRRIIGSFTHAGFGENTKNKTGLQLQQFKYCGNEYSCIYADEVLNVYFVELQA